MTPPQLWLAALRSGKYRPCKHRMNELDEHSRHCYCPFGVACVVAESQGVEVRRLGGRISGQDLYAQPAVLQWLGLKDGIGQFAEFVEGGPPCSIAALADAGAPYAEIADVIEANWDRLWL